jgi:hypothetical protein
MICNAYRGGFGLVTILVAIVDAPIEAFLN